MPPLTTRPHLPTLLRYALATFAILASLSARATNELNNEGLALVPQGAANTYSVSFWGRAGFTYFIERSEDLTTWYYFPVIEVGADETIEYGLFNDTNRFFTRVRRTDLPTGGDPLTADFDGDGVSNLLEVQDGLNPFSSDADGDGLDDLSEWLLSIGHLRQTDSDSDGYPDSVDDYPLDPSRHTYTGSFMFTLVTPSSATILP